jgi:hypothetical protein
MKLIISLCVLVCGCAALPGVPAPSAEVAHVVEFWGAAGLPVSSQCRAEQPDVRFEVADPTAFETLCRRPFVLGGFDSCFINAKGGVMHMSGAPTVVVAPATDLPGHRAHELLHWLSGCALHDQDRGHANIRVWGSPTEHRAYGGPDGLLVRLGG